jgi:hypothetical protein
LLNEEKRTIVIGCSEGSRFAYARGQALFEMIAESAPIAEMHVINQAGQFCYREKPEAFNQFIRGFVEAVNRNS